MYNSLFWSISPQDAVTQGGFLVDIVDDDILTPNDLPPIASKTAHFSEERTPRQA